MCSQIRRWQSPGAQIHLLHCNIYDVVQGSECKVSASGMSGFSVLYEQPTLKKEELEVQINLFRKYGAVELLFK